MREIVGNKIYNKWVYMTNVIVRLARYIKDPFSQLWGNDIDG